MLIMRGTAGSDVCVCVCVCVCVLNYHWSSPDTHHMFVARYRSAVVDLQCCESELDGN